MNAAFIVVGLVASLCAMGAVSSENSIHAALFTLCTLAGVAAEFALLSSPFLASMQILLYAGAIMVLFVFVIMLLSLNKEEHGQEPPLMGKVFAGMVAGGVLMFLFIGIIGYRGQSDWSAADQDAVLSSFGENGLTFGSTAHFGRFLYGNSAVPFELASVLITAAVAGVILLARKHAPTTELIAQEVADAEAKKLHLTSGAPGAPHAPHPQANEAVDVHNPVGASGAQEAHR